MELLKDRHSARQSAQRLQSSSCCPPRNSFRCQHQVLQHRPLWRPAPTVSPKSLQTRATCVPAAPARRWLFLRSLKPPRTSGSVRTTESLTRTGKNGASKDLATPGGSELEYEVPGTGLEGLPYLIALLRWYTGQTVRTPDERTRINRE